MNIAKLVFKNIVAIIAAAFCTQLSMAAELPQEAQREVTQLKKFVNQKTLETEKRILRKKQDAIRALERYEKSIKNDFAKNLIKLQLIKYRKEVEQSEAKVLGKTNNTNGGLDPKKGRDKDAVRSASRIIDFEVSYFYTHPLEKFKHQRGEMQFFEDGSVQCIHRTGKKVEMNSKWKWSMKDGKIMIKADGFHGSIYVTRKSPKEIYLDWKGLVNKKNVAKQN